MFGITAAAIDPNKAPKTPDKVEPVGLPVSAVPRVTDLQIGMAPQLLQPLTNLLIQADVARIHVLDISGKAFAPLADRDVLTEAIPDLKRFGDNVEIWSEFILDQPLTVADVTVPVESSKKPESDEVNADKTERGSKDDKKEPAAPATRVHRVQFRTPKIVISIAIKTDPNSRQWTQYVEFTCNMKQTTATRLLRPDYQTRAFRLDWVGEPEITVTGQFAPGYKPQNSELKPEKIGARFTEGWRAWTSRGPVSQVTVPDIEFGYSRLRVSEIGWSDPDLYVTFSIPKNKITNTSKVALVYETRGPNSGWGGPYSLQPGKSHVFEIPYPLTYRRRTETGVEVYTLPVGSHSEFRVPLKGGSPRLFAASAKTSRQAQKQTTNATD